jgi:hypothetical protein
MCALMSCSYYLLESPMNASRIAPNTQNINILDFINLFAFIYKQ